MTPTAVCPQHPNTCLNTNRRWYALEATRERTFVHRAPTVAPLSQHDTLCVCRVPCVIAGVAAGVTVQTEPTSEHGQALQPAALHWPASRATIGLIGGMPSADHNALPRFGWAVGAHCGAAGGYGGYSVQGCMRGVARTSDLAIGKRRNDNELVARARCYRPPAQVESCSRGHGHTVLQHCVTFQHSSRSFSPQVQLKRVLYGDKAEC